MLTIFLKKTNKEEYDLFVCLFVRSVAHRETRGADQIFFLNGRGSDFKTVSRSQKLRCLGNACMINPGRMIAWRAAWPRRVR